MTCSTSGPEFVRPLGTVDGVVLLHRKPVQLGLYQLFLLMKSTVEFQLLLGVLAEFPGKELTLSDNQLSWTVLDENWIRLAAIHGMAAPLASLGLRKYPPSHNALPSQIQARDG